MTIVCAHVTIQEDRRLSHHICQTHLSSDDRDVRDHPNKSTTVRGSANQHNIRQGRRTVETISQSRKHGCFSVRCYTKGAVLSG